MKRFSILALVLLFASLAHAGTISGIVTNTSQYSKVVVCSPELSYAGEFMNILSGVNHDGTNRESAASLLGFFQSPNKGSCWNVRPDGQFTINLPDGEAFIFFLAMTDQGEHAYWHVWSVDASIGQVVTADAPTF